MKLDNYSYVRRINTAEDEFIKLANDLMDIIQRDFVLGSFKIHWLIEGECLEIMSQYKLNDPFVDQRDYQEILEHFLENDYIYYTKPSKYLH